MRSYIALGGTAALFISVTAWAQAGHDHSAHTPSDAAATQGAPDARHQAMRAMHEGHQKMQSAKTPGERAALRDEHMKLMQAHRPMRGPMGDRSGQ